MSGIDQERQFNRSIPGARRGAIIVAAIAGTVLLLSSVLPSVDNGPVLCIFRRLTTLPCPSCGMTRGFIALGHGDLRKALTMNVASPVAYAATWAIFALAVVQCLTGRDILAPLWSRVARIVLIVTIGVMGLAWLVNLARRLWHL